MKRKNIRRLRHLLHILRWWREHTTALRRAMAWIAKKLGFLRFLVYINPLRYIKVLDWYIIRKFIGTYIYSIALIISISIVFDVNENLAKFSQYHAPLKAVVFDYYANFVPYFANLFSPLFVFIAVIFFTSKLASPHYRSSSVPTSYRMVLSFDRTSKQCTRIRRRTHLPIMLCFRWIVV